MVLQFTLKRQALLKIVILLIIMQVMLVQFTLIKRTAK